MTEQTLDQSELQESLDSFFTATTARLDEIERRVGDVATKSARGITQLETRMNRVPAGGGDYSSPELERKTLLEAFGHFGRSGEAKSMSAGAGPDGGFLMQPELAAAIRQRAAQVSPIRGIAQVITLTNADTYEEPAFTTLAEAAWAAEAATRPATTTPTVEKVSIATHDLYCNPAVTQRLLDNSSYDVGSALVERIGRAFAKKEGAAFIVGNGVGKPRGFTTYTTATTDDDSRAWGTLQHVVSGAATDIKADGLIELSEKLAPEFRPAARWVMSRATVAKVRLLKDGQGRPLWEPGLAGGVPPSLLGYPVVVADDMPAVAAGNLAVAFGDFAGYAVVDAKAMTILRDPFTNKPYVHFYTFARVGGGVLDFDAIKLLKISA